MNRRLYLSLSAFLIATVSSAASGQPVQPTPSMLPEGRGKQLVVEYCAKCHELKRIEEDQGTEAEWITRIRRMIRRGATIPTDQIEPLGKYLAQALPPRVRLQSGESSPIAIAVAEVALRPIQTWVRTAGKLQADATTIIATLSAPESELLKVGQRVKAFALSARSSMYQAKVTQVTRNASGVQLVAQLSVRSAVRSEMYLLEIITESPPVLSIPNEAIIEESDRRLVYVQQGAGYLPREIQIGQQGELHTEVTAGLQGGEQVVTFGSFFIDAEYKLKANSAAPTESETLAIEYRAKQPPHEGMNAVEVVVRDASGKPVTDSSVDVTYSMAAMPSMNMPEMREAFPLQHTREGKYAGEIRLSMAGSWQVKITVSKDGQLIGRKEFSVIAK